MGQNSNIEYDPRKLHNSKEITEEMGEQYEKDRLKELRDIEYKKQILTKDQLQKA